MSLNIGRILDPAGIFIKDKPQQKNVTINNYYGNQGPRGHHPPHHCPHNQGGQMNPQNMMAMFGMLMQMCQMMGNQGQQNGSFDFANGNGSFASAQASNGNSFAYAQAGTFNFMS